jgi:hypothetical protein
LLELAGREASTTFKNSSKLTGSSPSLEMNMGWRSEAALELTPEERKQVFQNYLPQ